MKQEKHLYFIALVPPDPIRSELMELKHYFKREYGSRASLNSAPHITLHMPFRYRSDRENKIASALESSVNGMKPFKLRLKDFSAFEPRVIFVDVEENSELQNLQKKVVKCCREKLKLSNAGYKKEGFHPHITIAFRDLRKPEFHRAMAEFRQKTYTGEFSVEEMYLLKHDGKNWQEYMKFSLE